MQTVVSADKHILRTISSLAHHDSKKKSSAHPIHDSDIFNRSCIDCSETDNFFVDILLENVDK